MLIKSIKYDFFRIPVISLSPQAREKSHESFNNSIFNPIKLIDLRTVAGDNTC